MIQPGLIVVLALLAIAVALQAGYPFEPSTKPVLVALIVVVAMLWLLVAAGVLPQVRFH